MSQDLPDNFDEKVPAGDNRTRLVCDTCGFIHYQNPKVVVGSVVMDAGRILLCRRAIEPAKGRWTLPAGYLEEGESAEEGAIREAREEANASLRLEHLLAVYSIPRISQVQLIFRARLAEPGVSAGQETEDVAFYREEDIPWDGLAFPSVHWAIRHAHAVQDQQDFPPFTNPPGEAGDKMPGSGGL